MEKLTQDQLAAKMQEMYRSGRSDEEVARAVNLYNEKDTHPLRQFKMVKGRFVKQGYKDQHGNHVDFDPTPATVVEVTPVAETTSPVETATTKKRGRPTGSKNKVIPFTITPVYGETEPMIELSTPSRHMSVPLATLKQMLELAERSIQLTQSANVTTEIVAESNQDDELASVAVM